MSGSGGDRGYLGRGRHPTRNRKEKKSQKLLDPLYGLWKARVRRIGDHDAGVQPLSYVYEIDAFLQETIA